MTRVIGRRRTMVRARIAAGVALCTLVLTACGGAADEAAPASTATAAAPAAPTGAATTPASEGSDPVGNACPADGCQIEITDVAPEGDELAVTWEGNFDPDVSRNHIHIYWDTYDAEQVSSDAEANGVTQGEWVPTDAYPTYVTDNVVSVANRGGSTTLCVTAADRDHAVLDPSLDDCVDVADALEG